MNTLTYNLGSKVDVRKQYSRKHSREKTFANFADLGTFVKVFFVKFLGVLL